MFLTEEQLRKLLIKAKSEGIERGLEIARMLTLINESHGGIVCGSKLDQEIEDILRENDEGGMTVE